MREEKGLTKEDQSRWFDEGCEELKNNKPKEALVCFGLALEKTPEDEATLALIGLAHFQLNELEAALDVYGKLAKENPQKPSYHLNWGLVCLKLNRPDDAIAALGKAKVLEPHNIQVLHYLGLAHAKNETYAKAYGLFLESGHGGLAKEMEAHLNEKERSAIFERVQNFAIPKGERPAYGEEDEYLDIFVEEESSEKSPVPSIQKERVKRGELSQWITQAVQDATLFLEAKEQEYTATGQDQSLRSFLQSNSITPALTGQTMEVKGSRQEILIAKVNAKILIREKSIVLWAGEIQSKVATLRMRGQQSEKVFGERGRELFVLSGNGYVVASAGDAQFTVLHLEHDALYIQEAYVHAFESTLRWENGRIPQTELSVVQFRGDGSVTLRCTEAISTVAVQDNHVIRVHSETLVGWSGKVIPRMASDISSKGASCIECSGVGSLLLRKWSI